VLSTLDTLPDRATIVLGTFLVNSGTTTGPFTPALPWWM
jgi:hypothetical protein